MNAEKIFGENVYVNLDEVIETVYQCRKDTADDEWRKRWLGPLLRLPRIEVSEDCISRVDLFEKMQSLCPETDKGCGDCHKACDIEDCLDFVMDAPSVVPIRAEADGNIVKE